MPLTRNTVPRNPVARQVFLDDKFNVVDQQNATYTKVVSTNGTVMLVWRGQRLAETTKGLLGLCAFKPRMTGTTRFRRR